MRRSLIVIAACLTAGCAGVRPVRDGAVYRSGQLAPADLEAEVKKHGIRTVVNLRGYQPNAKWYQDQTALLDRLNVKQVDLTVNPNQPEKEEVAALLDVYRRAEKPILVHSRSANGAVGVASGIYRVGVEKESPAQARKELAAWQSSYLPFLPLAGHDKFLASWKDETAGAGKDYETAKNTAHYSGPRKLTEEATSLEPPPKRMVHRSPMDYDDSPIILGEPHPIPENRTASRSTSAPW